jgi:hypothetical protein
VIAPRRAEVEMRAWNANQARAFLAHVDGDRLGCVPATPYVWEHAIANVASLARQELVQRMPDGNAPDDFAVNIGDPERCGDATCRQIDRKTLPLKQFEVVDPRHALSILQPELEAIVVHGSMSCHERTFVACL